MLTLDNLLHRHGFFLSAALPGILPRKKSAVAAGLSLTCFGFFASRLPRRLSPLDICFISGASGFQRRGAAQARLSAVFSGSFEGVCACREPGCITLPWPPFPRTRGCGPGLDVRGFDSALPFGSHLHASACRRRAPGRHRFRPRVPASIRRSMSSAAAGWTDRRTTAWQLRAATRPRGAQMRWADLGQDARREGRIG